MKKKTSGMVFPGEYVAEIEEFQAGHNTFVVDGTIRSSALGKKEYDFKRRMIKIKLVYVNNKLCTAGLSAIASARTGNNKGWNRDRYNKKPKSIYRIGDIIRGQISSLLNSSIHLAVDGTNFGLLYSLCLNCGGDTVKVNNGIKCIECSTYEEKRVANDYGSSALKSLYQT